MLPIDLTAILVPLGSFLMVAAIVITPLVLRHLRQREVQSTLRLAIEKGQTLDPKLIEKLMEGKRRRRNTPDADLRGGVITLFVAAGLAVFGYMMGGDVLRPLTSVGALVALIGLGQVAAWALRRKAKPESEETDA